MGIGAELHVPLEAMFAVIVVAIGINLAIMALLVASIVRGRRAARDQGTVTSRTAAPAEADQPSAAASLNAAGRAGTPEPRTTPTSVASERRRSSEPPGPARRRIEPSRWTTEPDTGLGDRNAWAALVADEQERAWRGERRAALVMIDLTMREGATAGGEGRPAQQESAEPTVRERTVRERTALRRPVERLMPSIARVLRLETRTSDLLARVGPGRIVAFLPATSGAQAAIVAERVRRSCGGWLDSVRVPVRLSVASADLVESGGIDAAFAALERSVERGADGETSSRGAS